MCGFVLSYAIGRDRLPECALAGRMGETLRHRGPDGHGRQHTGATLMEHRRLAIIDLDGGAQPMASPDGRAWIVFNGEIYNFAQVREELAAAGRAIDTKSDTEVLLHAYLQWGEACLERLNGMFAFAIYDTRERSIFAARDRFGEKPLYLMERDGVLYLASELKALVEAGLVERRLDPLALYNYFANGYVMGPRTIFRGVRRLQPGHWLKACSDGGMRVRRYWSPPVPLDEPAEEGQVIEDALDLLRDSVRLRLVADVPVGFFLSGGVDSSAVVALASEAGAGQLETFSIGFREPRYDEREHARFVAGRFGTRHHEFVLEPGSLDTIERIAWHADEPFADSSALPTWHLAQLTRQHVKVALSGDGGDEVFAGYDAYRGHLLSEKLRRLPKPALSAAAAVLRRVRAPDCARVRALRLARNIEDAALEAGERFVAKQQVAFRRDFIAAGSPLLAPYATAASDRVLFATLFQHLNAPLAGMALWQQTVSLADDMLVKVDRMSMAHSLEVRAPFLDHRLAELMNRVDFGTKLPGGRQKYILRRAMERYFPASFLWRRKQGFSVPLDYWFRDSLGDYIRQALLAPGAMAGHVFRREVLERVLGEHARRVRDWSFALWTLLMFEVWCRRYKIAPEALAT